MNERSIPYITLAWGLYEGKEDPIKFATEHLEEVKTKLSAPLDNITKVYQELEIYADQLGAQQIITLSQLIELYALGKTLSDDKIAKAVLTSLATRHLSFKEGISHCQKSHIDDAKNIVASTITYLKQEATIDAMVYIANALYKKPNDYKFAAKQGQTVEAKKLSGNKLFSAPNKQLVDQIRLLLIYAHNISLQVEEKQLDDAYILFTVKQELIKQGVNEQLANVIAIITGSSYFLEDNSSIPTSADLEKAAEWLTKSEALINHKANQASAVKFLQEYFLPNSSAKKALQAANVVKQAIYQGDSLEGQLKYKGRIAELSWTAFVIAQDYGANYYFSPIDGAFKINRNQEGNGLYAAILPSIRAALKGNADDPIHKVTVEQFAKNIRASLAKSKGIIVKQFGDIVRNNANVLSVPAVFAKELNLLRSSYLQRENLTPESRKILDQEIATYLETISTRYLEFINNNPSSGCDIELQAIASYYNLRIKQHAHLADEYHVINPNAKLTAHVFYAPHQGCYHNLELQTNLNPEIAQFSSSDYIDQAIYAKNCNKLERYLEIAIAISSLHNSIVWQSNKDIDPELVEQKIGETLKKGNSFVIASLKQHADRLLKNKTCPANTTLKQEPKKDFTLSPVPAEQISIIEQEALVGVAYIEFIAAANQVKLIDRKQDPHKFTAAEKLTSTTRDRHIKAKLALHEIRQRAGRNQYVRDLLKHHHAMFILELKALGIANIEAYRAWWENIIKEQTDAIETSFAITNSQLDKYIVGLKTAYEQKLTEVDNHWADILNKNIQAYYEYERQVAEAKRTARRKRRQKLFKACAGMVIAACVAPVLAQSMFSAGFACTVATGVIAGGISSGIAGNNILKGAAMGGLFAGFGFACDNILGEFIKNNDLLRESLNVAATASLSTAIYGSKVLDNVLASVGANVVASLMIPLPKFNADNKTLTQKELLSFMQRKTARVFTSCMLSSVATKNPNLGMSLMMSGMGALQSWIGYQANMFMLDRNVKQQAISIRRPNKPSFSTSNQQVANHTPPLSSNSKISNNKPLSSSDRGKIGGYKINLPNIALPALNNEFAPNRRSIIFSDPLTRYRGVAVSSIPDPIPSDFHLNLGTRALGLVQAVGGTSLATASVAGGIVSLGTGLGPILAAGYATIGADSAIAGAKAFITGEHHHTLLFRGFKGAGLSDNTAMWAEVGVNLSFLAPVVVRSLGNVAKNSMLKLYDLRNSVVRNITFKSEADPFWEILGHAKVSHPEEYNFIMQDLKNNGVTIKQAEKTIAFSPNTSGGNTGNAIYLPEDFSISALRHEYGHFIDHKNLGFPKHIEYFERPELIIATERKQYLTEIKLAKKLGDYNARKTLVQNYLEERDKIINRYYQKPYGSPSKSILKLKGNI